MISILSTSYMRIKHLLFVVSFLFSLPVLSQETDSISHTYPILGYYRLGMTEEEFLSQMFRHQCNNLLPIQTRCHTTIFRRGYLFPRWEIGFFYRQCLIINRLGCRALLHAGRISLARKPISHKSHVRHS